jgi:hypothetical protein
MFFNLSTAENTAVPFEGLHADLVWLMLIWLSGMKIEHYRSVVAQQLLEEFSCVSYRSIEQAG